jgi:hypothetical protein
MRISPAGLRDLQGVIVSPLQAAELAAILGLMVRSDDSADEGV